MHELPYDFCAALSEKWSLSLDHKQESRGLIDRFRVAGEHTDSFDVFCRNRFTDRGPILVRIDPLEKRKEIRGL